MSRNRDAAKRGVSVGVVVFCVSVAAGAAYAAGRASASRGGPALRAPRLVTAASVDAAAPSSTFEFAPGVSAVWVNIGSHKDPPLPPNLTTTAVIAVEPILQTAMRINRSHANIHVITAAISDSPGFASMTTFNSGASSSLRQPEPGRWWAQPGAENRKYGMPSVAFVPVLPMRALLDAIPERVRVEFMKTDMQGVRCCGLLWVVVASPFVLLHHAWRPAGDQTRVVARRGPYADVAHTLCCHWLRAAQVWTCRPSRARARLSGAWSA